MLRGDVSGSRGIILSAGAGAAATVMIATRLGLPISTTHALIGGFVGAGLMQGTGVVNFGKVAGTFLLPLLLSPFLAAMLGFIAYRLRRVWHATNDCVCVAAPEASVPVAVLGVAAIGPMESPRVIIGTGAQCDRLAATTVHIRISAWRDHLHTLSAASICFARGVNDTPKLVAILLAAQLFDARVSVVAVAMVMAIGGLTFSHRVARTMSQRIAKMDPAQGLAANLISAMLILIASKLGVPVSTTHVAVGSIAGASVSARTLDWPTLRNIGLSWVVTLPLAATIAASVAVLMRC